MNEKIHQLQDPANCEQSNNAEPGEMDRREALAALGKAALVVGAAPAMTTLLTSKKVKAQSCCGTPPDKPKPSLLSSQPAIF